MLYYKTIAIIKQFTFKHLIYCIIKPLQILNSLLCNIILYYKTIENIKQFTFKDPIYYLNFCLRKKTMEPKRMIIFVKWFY